MTISYSDTFVKLLVRWKGSLWKAIWKHLVVFLICYYTINAIYRFYLTPEEQVIFMKYIVLFDSWTKEIPLTFLLGFYVAMIVGRWWDCCQLISWPDHLLYNVSALIRGDDPETRIIRKTIARYVILASVLAWRSISLRVLTRYPTDDHLVDSGLMTKEELALFKTIEVKVDPHQKWFVPINWIQTMMVRCFEKGTLTHTNELRVLLDALEKYRDGFFRLFIYDWIAIPLVYTQVSTISVYGYFAFALIGRQFPTENENKQIVDLYVPVFTILQFLFYVGWLKVGEDLMFPFGADDEDFEFGYILERNLEIAMLIVDDLHNQVPPVYVESLEDDIRLIQTTASAALASHPQRQHLRKYKLTSNDMKITMEREMQKCRSILNLHAPGLILSIARPDDGSSSMADAAKTAKEKPAAPKTAKEKSKDDKVKEMKEKPNSSGPKKEGSKKEKSKKEGKSKKEKKTDNENKEKDRKKNSDVKTAKKDDKAKKKDSKNEKEKKSGGAKVEEGKVAPKEKPIKKSKGPVDVIPYVSDDEEEAHSEDIIVYETAEDVKHVNQMTLAKLARMGFRRPLWTDKLSSYFVIIAFLNTYDTMITFTLCMSVYGAVFALVYCLMMMILGFPLLYMELALGQFTSNNIYGVFDRMSAAFAGIGIAATLFNFISMINDQMLVTYTMNLFMNSINVFTNEMPWHNCVSSTNTESCRELYHKCDQYQQDYGDLPDGVAEQLGLRYMPMGNTCIRSRLQLGTKDGNEDWHLQDVDKVPLHQWFTGESLGQHFFWNMEVTGNSMKYLTWPTYEFLMYSFVGWGIIYFCSQLSKNFISNFSKFLVITTMSVLGTFAFIALAIHPPQFPYIYATQTNIVDVFSTHKDVLGIFVSASLLVVRSMKLGQGAMIYLGSQYQFRNNIVVDCILITVVMCFCPLTYSLCHLLSMDSFILYLVNGDMERWMNVRNQNSAQDSYIFSSGHPILQLVMFVQSMRLYAEFEPVIVCLFSFMGIISAIGNKIVRVEIIVTTLVDTLPVFADRIGRKTVLHLTICMSSLLMFLLVSRKGFEMMISFEEVVVPVMGASIILLQLFVVCVFYGPRRLLANILAMNNRKNQEQESRIAHTITNAVVLCLWCFVIPVILIGSIIVHFIYHVRPGEGNREVHITDLPYVFCILTLSIVPIIAVVRMLNQYRNSNNVMPVLRANRDLWGPRSSEDREHALKFEKMLRTR